MSEYGSYPGDVVSACQLVGGTGAILGQGLRVSTSARAGPGVYTVTLAEGVDTLRAVVLVTPRTATFAAATAVQVSDTVVGITTFDAAGAPLDADLHMAVLRTSS